MSGDACGHVYRYSPYTGATFAVHVAIADSVNDQNNNECWLATAKLATKARIDRRTAQRALDQLVADGWLAVLVEGGAHGNDTTRYQFHFREEEPVVYDTRRSSTGSTQGRREAAPTRVEGRREAAPRGGDRPPYPKENPTTGHSPTPTHARAARQEGSRPVVRGEELCVACYGSGRVLDDDDVAHPCAVCGRVE